MNSSATALYSCCGWRWFSTGWGLRRRLRSALLGRSRGGFAPPSVFARLCDESGIDGIFLRAFPDRKDTRRVLSAAQMGSVACHALLQRLANPSNPPADLVLE